jgi:hypothetical protein
MESADVVGEGSRLLLCEGVEGSCWNLLVLRESSVRGGGRGRGGEGSCWNLLVLLE